jgi:type II secretory pathway pseudopilin PulG
MRNTNCINRRGAFALLEILVIICIVALFAALAVPKAAAQVPTYAPQIVASTNGSTVFTAAASTATNIMAVIDCRKQSTVALSIVTTNVLAETVNANILYYQRSVDGVNYETALYPVGWTSTLANKTIVTNLLSYGAGYIRFPYCTNTSGSGTNIGYLQMYYGVKISAP